MNFTNFLLVFVSIFGLSAALNQTELEAYVNGIESSTKFIMQSYYNMTGLRRASEADQILAFIKEEKPKLKLAIKELSLQLEDLPATNFADRWSIPLVRIEMFKFVEMLNQVAGSILRYREGISAFPEPGVPSELVVEQIQLANFNLVANKVYEIDNLLNGTLTKVELQQKVEEQEKKQINEAISKFLVFSEDRKQNLLSAYTHEVEKLTSEGQRLDLAAANDAQKFIGFWWFTVEFMHNYKKLLATLL